MFKIDYIKLQKSISRLLEQYENYLTTKDNSSLRKLDKEAIRESVIQRFEVCFDTAWKSIKKGLEEKVGLPKSAIPNGPKPLIRLAFENDLIVNIENWNRYNQARINTSHDYAEEKAFGAMNVVDDFIEDVIKLYEQISDKKWK